jgi:DNA repair exonuclease SbcCD nuclease subunit
LRWKTKIKDDKFLNHKEINIIFFSDTHLGFDYPLRPRVNKPHRGEDFFKNFKAVLSYATINKVDLIVHGGDLFFRSKVPDPIVDRVYQTLTTFADSQIPVYIVPGNHERSHLPTSLFLNHPYIHVFDLAKIFSIIINNSRIILGGFPFIRSDIRGGFSSILHQSGWYSQDAHIKILVFHQAVEGATVGPGNFTFRNGKDFVPLSLLPNDANALLCGHIHRQQILNKITDKNTRSIPVIFSGSTERTSFAEKDEKKGFYHLIFDNNGEQNWILKESRFIELPSRPMKDIYIDSEISAQHLESYLRKKVSQIDQDTIVRFRSHKPIREDLVILWTTTNLRQLLPSGLNFTFSSHFFKKE